MKGINFNQRPTPVAKGSSRAICEDSIERMWELMSTVSVPSGFSILIVVLGVCCNSSVPSRAFAMSSPLELIIMPLLRWQLLSSPSLAGIQTLVSNTTRGRRLTFRDSLYYPIQCVESKDGATWELIRGLGILVHPSPPGGSLSSTNLLYSEDFLKSVWSRRDLNSVRGRWWDSSARRC